MSKYPFGMSQKQFKASALMAFIVALAVIWKLFVELPKSWRSSKTTSEKLSCLTILI